MTEQNAAATPPATPPSNPTPEPAPAPAPEPPPAAASGQPFAVFPDADSFNARVSREARKQLRALGVDDPEGLKTTLAEHEALKTAQEEQRQAQLSELEREREARAGFERQAADAMGAAEESALRAHLYQVFAEKGVKNFDYAFWAVTTKLAKLGDEEELDERAYLDELLAEDTSRAALGAALPSVHTSGATTTDDAKPTPTAAPAPATTDVFDESREAFNDRLQKLGFAR